MRAIVERLERAGHEAWCVGGAVRDALLGLYHLDWDIATAARPDYVRRLFKRTIPVGIEFGTVGVLDERGVLHEVTTFRRDVRTDGRHAEVEFGVSLEEDLARRDFTINAMAFSPSLGELRDPFGGQADLERRVVRAVGDARARMREDRLRALRAIRFASRFGFEIEPATWSAIVESAPYLGRLSAERVKQEIEKTLEQVRAPSGAFRKWRESGAFGVLVPPLSGISDDELAVVDALPMTSLPERRPARRVLRIAALFLGVSGGEVRAALRALRFSNTDVNAVTRIVDGWVAIGPDIERALVSQGAGVTDAQLRRWIAALGRTEWTLVMRIASAVWSAARDRGARVPSEPVIRAVYRRGVRIAYRDPVAVGDLAVDGDDLQAAGIGRGPAIGRILTRLIETVVEDPRKNQRDVLLALARELAEGT